MKNDNLPLSDLELLRKEVLSGPPDAALPSRLPDHWLHLIARDLEMAISNDTCTADTQPSYAAAPMALIVHLLRGKSGGRRLEISLTKMFQHFRDYETEIAIEMLNRRTDLKLKPATLKTILTNRNVKISKNHVQPLSALRDIAGTWVSATQHDRDFFGSLI